jgi:hypothetical protein
VRGQLHRVRRRPRPPARMAGLAGRRLLGAGDGLPRPGRRRHRRRPGGRPAAQGPDHPRRPRPGRLLLSPPVHRRRPCRRRRADPSRGRPHPSGGGRREPGRRHRPGGRRATHRSGRGPDRRPVPDLLPARHRDHRRLPVPRALRPAAGQPRQGRAGLRHPGLLRRPALRRPRHRARPLHRRPDGRHLPTFHRVRRLQPLPGPETAPGLALQRPRERRQLPAPGHPSAGYATCSPPDWRGPVRACLPGGSRPTPFAGGPRPR